MELLEPVVVVSPPSATALALLGAAEFLDQQTPAADLVEPVAALTDGDFAAANRLFRATTGGRRGDADLLEWLGLSYLGAAQFDAAATAFDHALMALPDNIRLQRHLARTHLASGQPADGLAVLTNVSRDVAGGKLLQQLERSLSAQQAANGEIALDELTRHISGNETDLDARWQLAGAEMDRGRFAEAAGHYEWLLDNGGAHHAVHNNLAWSYLQLGDSRARDHAETAFRAAPDDSDIADTLGWILAQSGELEAGRELLVRATLLAPGDTASRYRLAWTLAELGDSAAAESILNTLLVGGAGEYETLVLEMLEKVSRAAEAP